MDELVQIDEDESHKYWLNVIKNISEKKQEKESHLNKSDRLIKHKIEFARKYTELIHSGHFTTCLIDLEFSYWPAIEDMFKTRDASVEDSQIRSGQEIERAIQQLGRGHTEESISLLSSRHCQDLERLLNNWNMSIEALKDSQREEFMSKLVGFWKEYEISQQQKTKSVSGTADIVSNNGNSIIDQRRLDSPPPQVIQATDDQLNAIKMEESFTVHLGSQLKTAHNLRLMAVDTLYLCDTRRNRSAQVRTQTAMSLYSHSLSAIVLLVDNQFNSYYGIQHEFAKLCAALPEFHFDNFDKQLKTIKHRVMPDHAGRHNLETGDCYITKHSNLAQAHLVFHLVTDDSLKQGDINSRHPVLSSLRDILRLAHMYDITTISIPLLLIDEMNEEILTVHWCIKRAELVLKCVKGFLIEMASLSTGIDQGTIQFLVPKGISEDLFASLANLVPEVFRLANSLNLRTN